MKVIIKLYVKDAIERKRIRISEAEKGRRKEVKDYRKEAEENRKMGIKERERGF